MFKIYPNDYNHDSKVELKNESEKPEENFILKKIKVRKRCFLSLKRQFFEHIIIKEKNF